MQLGQDEGDPLINTEGGDELDFENFNKTNARLWHLFPLVTLEIIGLTVLVPYLPQLYSDFFGGVQKYVYWVAGGTMAINSFLTFAFAPTIGKISDSFGRKPFLLIAVVGSHLQYVVLALDGNLWIYFSIAAASGVVAVSIALISSFIGDVCPPKERSRAFGQVVGVLGIGGLLGIGLGGTLHYDVCKWLPLIFMVVNSFYIIFCVPESLYNPDRRWAASDPLEGVGYLRKTPLIETVAAMTFLATVAQNGIQDTILFYLKDQQSFTTEMLATFLVVGMGATVLVQWVGLPFMENHLNHRSILVFGLTCASTAIGLYGVARFPWQFYIIIVINSFGYLTFTVGAALVANEVGKKEQGVLQGAFAGLNKFAMGMGPLIFNSLAGATADTYPKTPFVVGVAVAILALFCAFRIVLPSPQVEVIEPHEK